MAEKAEGGMVKMKSIFEESVERHFSFLIHEYGFSITEKMSYPGDTVSQGKIVYTSGLKQADTNPKQVIVRVLLDRGYLDVDIGSPDLHIKDYFGLHEIMKTIAPDVDMNFSPDYSKHAKDIIEPQAEKLSNIVAIHCKSFLNGDFSIGDVVIKARIDESQHRIQAWKEK